MKLYEHQRETMEFYAKNKFCLNTSEMGTGKTAPSLLFALEQLKQKNKRVVVVSPASVMHNWKDEFKKFADFDAQIYPEIGKVTIISADRIAKANQLLFDNLSCLIVDEAHWFCNIDTQRTKALHKYVSQGKPEHLILLTGTPMRNRVPELYSLLILLDYGDPRRRFHHAYPSHFSFCHFFCEQEEVYITRTRTKTRYFGCKQPDMLRAWISPVRIEYELSELKDIPELIMDYIRMPKQEDQNAILDFLTESTLDQQLEEGWRSIDLGNRPPAHISSAKRESAILKSGFTAELAAELVPNCGRIAIFTAHIASAHLIAQSLSLRKSPYAVRVITGETPVKTRHAYIQDFTAGHVQILVGTIGAMGTGINLQAANTCIFNDRSWVPAENWQARRRLQRIGQRSVVRIYDIHRSEVDAKITKKLQEKEKLIKEILGDAKSA